MHQIAQWPFKIMFRFFLRSVLKNNKGSNHKEHKKSWLYKKQHAKMEEAVIRLVGKRMLSEGES
jgi:3-phenylpropionate/cinnamic acid dioxygenase small subunit